MFVHSSMRYIYATKLIRIYFMLDNPNKRKHSTIESKILMISEYVFSPKSYYFVYSFLKYYRTVVEIFYDIIKSKQCVNRITFFLVRLSLSARNITRTQLMRWRCVGAYWCILMGFTCGDLTLQSPYKCAFKCRF